MELYSHVYTGERYGPKYSMPTQTLLFIELSVAAPETIYGFRFPRSKSPVSPTNWLFVGFAHRLFFYCAFCSRRWLRSLGLPSSLRFFLLQTPLFCLLRPTYQPLNRSYCSTTRTRNYIKIHRCQWIAYVALMLVYADDGERCCWCKSKKIYPHKTKRDMA